jgi:hypothetical protein
MLPRARAHGGDQEGCLMAEKVRLGFQVMKDLNRPLEEMADEAGMTKNDVLRQALTLMKVAQDGKRQKRHLGFTSDPGQLETETVGLL